MKLKTNFRAAITDLAWGVGGNVLFACSTDGSVAAVEFNPGVLGEFISEGETHEMIRRNYGEIVLRDYEKNLKIVGKRPAARVNSSLSSS